MTRLGNMDQALAAHHGFARRAGYLVSILSDRRPVEPERSCPEAIGFGEELRHPAPSHTKRIAQVADERREEMFASLSRDTFHDRTPGRLMLAWRRAIGWRFCLGCHRAPAAVR
jgi:hypothetical protein